MSAFPIRDRAEHVPDGWALRDPGTSFTWPELLDRLCRATAVLDGLELEPNERIGVMARNSSSTVLAYLAGLHAGASVIPISYHLTASEVEYILTDGGAGAILCDASSDPVAREAAERSGVRTVISWADGSAPDQDSPWERLLAAAPAAVPDPNRRPRPNLLYTSGTTGFPKGVERPPTLPGTLGDYLTELATKAGVGPFLVAGPLYHTGPQRAVQRLAGGRPVYVLPQFDARQVLEVIDAQRITGTLMVPAHFVRLLALPEEERRRYEVSSMTDLDHTGAACPIAVKHAMIEWFGPILNEKYGGTESGTLCSITSPEWLEHPGSVGRALPPFEAMAVDDHGEPLPVGENGRLFFRDTTGNGIRYFGAPEKTAEVHLAPNVFTVGDSGYVDADGYVYITGRHSDMVLSGGVNLYPAESERVLRTHPAVVDVAVIGVPHPTMGEELKALVVVRDDADVDGPTLIAYCRENLAHLKCPRSVDFVDDLGRNAMGKVNKKALAAPYWEDVQVL